MSEAEFTGKMCAALCSESAWRNADINDWSCSCEIHLVKRERGIEPIRRRLKESQHEKETKEFDEHVNVWRVLQDASTLRAFFIARLGHFRRRVEFGIPANAARDLDVLQKLKSLNEHDAKMLELLDQWVADLSEFQARRTFLCESVARDTESALVAFEEDFVKLRSTFFDASPAAAFAFPADFVNDAKVLMYECAFKAGILLSKDQHINLLLPHSTLKLYSEFIRGLFDSNALASKTRYNVIPSDSTTREVDELDETFDSIFFYTSYNLDEKNKRKHFLCFRRYIQSVCDIVKLDFQCRFGDSFSPEFQTLVGHNFV